MPAQFFGAQAAVAFLNRAFANTSPSNAAFTNQVTNATAALAAGADPTQAISYTAFAKTFGNAYAAETAAQLATRLMTNTGLLPNAALETALAEYITAVGVGNIGIVALQLAVVISTKEGDATYGAAALAWNNELNSAVAYSSNPANTTASNGDVVATQGQTYTLTANVENVVGTGGNDTIIAGEGSAGGVHTLGSSDVISGGAGADTIDIISSGTALVPRMSGVEKVLYQSLTGASALNMVNATGTTEIWSNNSTSGLTVTNLNEKALIGAKGGNSSALTVQANAAAITGDLAISLDKAKVGAMIVNSTGAGGATGYTSTTINAVAGTTTADRNTVASLDVGSTLATVKVIGDGALTVAGNLAATVRTIDASANKGGANLSITNNTGNTTFTGGEGADRINFGGTLTLADKVDGGAARDTLGVTSQASIVAGLQVTNTEILELAALSGTLNAALIAGVDEVQVTTALDDVGAAIVNGLTSNSTFVTNDNGQVQLNLTNAQVAGTQDTLNLKTGVAGTTNVGTDVWVSATGVETVAYTQNNLAAAGADTEVSFWDAVDGVIDMQSLSITNTAGNTARFNGLVNTIKTVNASAAAGAVAVSVATGNSTNGVSITGGAGADSLTGGDGKDIIVAGAGNDAVSGDAFTTILGTGGVAIPQVSTLTLANVEAGDTFSALVNGVNYTGATAAALAAAIGTAGGTIVSAVAAGDVITLTGLANGTAFTVAGNGTTNFAGTPAVAEVSTVTISGAAAYDAGDILRVTVNGIDFNVTATQGQTAAALATTLAGAITAAGQMTAAVTAVGGDSVITLTGTNATASYTVAATMATEVSANVAAVPSTKTLTLASATEVAATETVHAQVNGITYSMAFNTSQTATLADFVTAHGASILAATGATLTSTGTTLVLTNAAGSGIAATVSGSITGGDGGTVTASAVAGNVAVVRTDNVDPLAVDNTFTPAVPAGATTQTITAAAVTAGQMSTTQYVAGAAAADTLTGGDGNDAFWLLSGSNGLVGTTFTTMDTITDLNLGGATAVVGVDTIIVNQGVFGAFAATDLINAGTALAMTGPTLAAAVQALFNAGGALNGSVNDVGLFTYGADSYLVVTDTAAGLTANDAFIKVTGVTGTLDLSDIVRM